MNHARMTRVGVLVVVCVALLALIASSCAKPAAPSPTAAAKPAPATTAVAPAKTSPATVAPEPAKISPAPVPAAPKAQILKYSIHTPKTSAWAVAMDWYMDEVEKRSGGRVKFERYYAGALAPQDGALDATSTGIADAATTTDFNFPAQLPLINVANLPGTSKEAWSALMAYNDLNKLPDIQNELKKANVRYLTPLMLPGYCIMTKKSVKAIDDLKGMKIRATGAQAKVLDAMGVATVNLQVPDVYEGLNRGTIDGMLTSPQTAVSYKHQEVAKYFYNLNLGQSLGSLKMNLATFNKLPADIQKMMDEVTVEHIDAYMRIYVVAGFDDAMKKFKDAGVQWTEPSAQEQARAVKVMEEVIWQKWLKDREAEKLPAKQIMDTWLSLVAKYEPLSKYK